MSDKLFTRGKIDRKRRADETRDLRAAVWLIICEGEKTEPNYFNQVIGLLNRDGIKIKAKIVGQGKNTKSLVDSCEQFFCYIDEVDRQHREKIPYTKIIFVFDKDSFSNEQFNEAVVRAERRYKDSIVAWSNENFELWLNLHFGPITIPFERKQYYKMLTDKFRKIGVYNKNQNYEKHGKNDPALLDKIIECRGSIENAIKNAEKVLEDGNLLNLSKYNPAKANPVTMVYKAIKALAIDAGSGWFLK